jgi:hypothetical protein
MEIARKRYLEIFGHFRRIFFLEKFEIFWKNWKNWKFLVYFLFFERLENFGKIREIF